jgi:hypothetical protein
MHPAGEADQGEGERREGCGHAEFPEAESWGRMMAHTPRLAKQCGRARILIGLGASSC